MKQLRKKICRKLSLLLLVFVLASLQFVYAQQIDVGISESSSGATFDINIRPDFQLTENDVIDGILFTIRWPDDYPDLSFTQTGSSLGFAYGVSPQGNPELYGNFYYLSFAGTPLAYLNQTLNAGQEYMLSSYEVSGNIDCASFEIIDDEWTQANNGGPYFCVWGNNCTGIIYEPIVNFGSVGGIVEGGCTINFCQCTGTLTLTEYDGTINKWQKRVDCCTWVDIACTEETYSEFPSCAGSWEYRAEVQKGTCSAEMSLAAEVIVNLPESTTWTGTTDNDWFKSSNWSVGVPSATLSGIIPAAPTNQPQISSNTLTAETNDLTIESGAVLSIETDGFLTVLGTLSNASGNSGLVIRSDALKTGSLIQSTAGVEATSERYINNWTEGNENRGWHFLSSPVSAQPIRPEFIPSGDPLPTEIDFYKWDEDYEGSAYTGCWINTKNEQGNWNTAFENNFNVGTGYLVAYTSPYGNMVKNFIGQLNVGDLTITNLSYTPDASYPGWHLIGNPYSSALDWKHESWRKTNIGEIAQIWEESAASYELIDNIGSDNYIIPANNGFMVFTNVDNSTLTIPADARVHSTIPLYKSSNVLSIRLLANDLDKGLKQQTTLRENPDATVDFDLQYDSYFIAGYAPMFYSVHGEDAFALNSIPDINNNTIIPIDFINNGSENYNIELSSAPPNMNIMLHDMKLNIVTNLKDEPIYEFTSLAGDNPHRFQIDFDAACIDETINDIGIKGWYANKILNIKSEQNSSIEVCIYTCYGQLVRQESFTGIGTHKLHLSLTSGMYIARVTSNKQLIPIKFFVKN